MVRGFTAREHAEFAAMAEREAVLSGAFEDDGPPASLLAQAMRPRAPQPQDHPAAEEASGIDRPPAPAKASEKVRSNATKILALRMLQGYSPSSEKCATCRVPLMDKGGIVQCVVCTNAATRSGKKGGMGPPPTSIILDRPAESRNDGEDVVATDEGFELLLHPHQERQGADDSGREDSTLGGSFVSMVGGDDLFQRTLSTKDSGSEEAGGLDGSRRSSGSEEGSASSGGSRRKANARLLERIDEMARRQREARELQEGHSQGQRQEGQQQLQQGQQQLPSQRLDLPDPPPRGHASHHSTGASTDATKVIDNSWRSSDERAGHDRGKAFAAAIVGGTHSILDDLASVGTQEPSVRGDGNGEGEEAAYQKGRAFASAIIRETNSILDDLVSVEEGRSVCGSALTPIAEGKVLEGSGAVAPRGRAVGPMSSSLPPRSPPVSPPARTKRPPTTAGAPPVHPLRASRAPPTPGQRKRMTINSLSNDQGLSRDHTRALQSTGGGSGGWLGHAPRRLEHAISKREERDSSVAEASAKAGGGNAVEGRPEDAKNSFFDELRHKALLSKAAHCEGKLRTAMKGASVLRIDTKARDGAGVVEARLGSDNVSALESPSHHSSLDFLHGTLSPTHWSVQGGSAEGGQSATNEELQQRWKAANNRQQKKRELEAEMAAAHTGARLKRIESCVPDDEKVGLARKCIREEGVALPFDERTPKTVPATRPGQSSPTGMALSPSSRTMHATSLTGSSGRAASAPSRIPSSSERRGREPLASTLALSPVPRHRRSSDLAVASGLAGVQESAAATEDGAGAPTNATDDAPASTDEPSLASLSSSVKFQTARIVALEADALRKHREAEAAAAVAKEALEEMVRTRNAREDEGQECSAASSSQYSDRAEEEAASYDDDGDSTALASSSDFDEAAPRRRGRAMRRGRSRSPRPDGRNSGDCYTPEPEGSPRHRSRPPPLRVDEDASSVGDSREETSTCSSLDMSEERFQGQRHHRSLSLPRQGGGRMKENLLLPTLGSPDPAGMHPNELVHHGRRERAGGSHRSHSASPRHLRAHRRRELAQPFASCTKPNYLLPYSPRGGYAPPSFYGDARAMRSRPVPLSRRIESEPMAARGYHHLNASCLPPYSPRGYSAALEARMAGLDLNSRYNAVPYGGVSMTPKSRYEQRRFGFDFERSGFDQPPHYPAANHFDSLSLAQHRAEQHRLNEERMIRERLAVEGGYFASRY